MQDILAHLMHSVGILIADIPVVAASGLLSFALLVLAWQKVSRNDRNSALSFLVGGGLFAAVTLYALWKQNTSGKEVHWSDLTASVADSRLLTSG